MKILSCKYGGVGQIGSSKWKKVDSREMGITQSMIPVPPWIVLKVLRKAGDWVLFLAKLCLATIGGSRVYLNPDFTQLF